ncbi:type II toxin-antitoxin system RelE/ParE family toxin [Pantoea sp.]|uniref:type II toxin-antitoxin system RelE/ParE family toxin n=1 Tax=Pantoea sp. TaxID=69393 RepID=UPI0031DBD183
MNNWEVVTTLRFAAWLQEQDDEMVEDVLASLEVLKVFGPMLGRPDVDTVSGSQFANMKELRIQSNGRPIRAFFAFDPVRKAVVLCAGDKTGLNQRRFYQLMIKLADKEYKQHLKELTDAKA